MRKIEPIHSETEDPRFLRMTFAVRNDETNLTFPSGRAISKA
ncbi:hypothetical protein [Ruegeria arenilitoris]|nr:hypothetical protein [Ruegeria arenilitoris]